MLDGLISQFKLKVDAILKSAICALIAGAMGLVALAFFCAAAFVWVERDQGTIAACLIFGGAFVAIALIAVIAMVVLRRRHEQEARRRAARTARTAALATALDLSRVLGGKRSASLALVSAFLVGLLLSQSTPKRED